MARVVLPVLGGLVVACYIGWFAGLSWAAAGLGLVVSAILRVIAVRCGVSDALELALWRVLRRLGLKTEIVLSGEAVGVTATIGGFLVDERVLSPQAIAAVSVAGPSLTLDDGECPMMLTMTDGSAAVAAAEALGSPGLGLS